jgi:hypothetical protein
MDRALTWNGSGGTEKGMPMSGTHQRPGLASYRDDIEEFIKTGKPFGDIEDAIEQADLNMDEKAALWLFAFSLRNPF